MDRLCEDNVLEVSVIDKHGKRQQLSFPDSTGDVRSHIDVNYTAYLQYINENYPDLHTFDIGIDEELESERKKMQKQLENDYKLLNKLDIEQYEGLNSPDDVWDSIAKSVYNMGFIGRYARMATSFESGINYIFTFKDFAHVYPFLKSCQGNGLLVRRMKGMKEVDNRKFNSYRVNYKELPEHSLGSANAPGIDDVESEKRSTFNQSFVLKPEGDNPAGTEWSYLSVDKDQIEVGNSYRRGYSYIASSSPNIHDHAANELEDKGSYADAVSNTSASSTGAQCGQEIESGSNDSLPDNRRYIYEKFLFCTYKWCPGSMRIILDCIHNVVILSTTNPHYDCSESHRRKIYDIVRKLFVVNHGDIDLIDAKYATIPRRYGLAFIESWIHSEEYENARSSDYTPSFLSYSTHDTLETRSWASQKNRNWVVDAFYETDSVSSRHKTAIPEKQKQETTHVKTKQNFLIHPQRQIDLKRYGIEYWNFDTHKYDLFGNVICRSEWEFHINQDVDEKNREVFRFWRKQYFGVSDLIRQASYRTSSIISSFGVIDYFLAHGGDHTFDTSKVRIFYFDEQPKQTKDRFFKDIHALTGDLIWKDFDRVLFRQSSYASLLPNPDFVILPYPLNKQVHKAIKNSNIDSSNPESQAGCFFVCSSLAEIANSDKLVICERDIEPREMRRAEWRALYNRKHTIHASDQIWSLRPNFLEAFGMMTIFDKNFLNNRHILDRFKSLNSKEFIDGCSFRTTIGEALRSECQGLKAPRVSIRNLPEKPEIVEEDRCVGFRILYQVDEVIKIGYVFCNPKKLKNAITTIVKKRTAVNRLSLVLLVDDSKCNEEQLQNISDKVDVIQIRELSFGKLKSMLPFDYLLFLMRALVVEKVDFIDGHELLKKRLPPQRKKDTEFYKLEFEGRRIASNAGLVRMAIKELGVVNDYLKAHEDEWRICETRTFIESPSLTQKEKWKFLPKGFPKFDNLQLTKLLSLAGRNKKNIELSKDTEKIQLFEWAINCVNVAEQENDCNELVGGDFRDLIELLKRTTYFV